MNLKEKLASINWGAVIIENDELSMGRVMCWVIFGAHFWFWFNTKTVPTTMFDILLVLFAYNFGKKFTGPLAEIMRSRMSGQATANLPTVPQVPAPSSMPETGLILTSSPAPAPSPAPAVSAEDIKAKLRAKLDATKPPVTTVLEDPFAEE